MEGESNFEVLPLHKHMIYIDDCCSILNAEWPRSRTARMHDLYNSCDELPCSLVLIKRYQNMVIGVKDEVIGHSKIGTVVGQPHCCCIKSVVIKSEYRKLGLGKYLMLKTEEYATCFGFQRCSLSTHDQQGFYTKLGYKKCLPMSFLTSGKTSRTSQLMEKLEKSKFSSNLETNRPKIKSDIKESIVSKVNGPPLPPPLPLSQQKETNTVLLKTWMEKELEIA